MHFAVHDCIDFFSLIPAMSHMTDIKVIFENSKICKVWPISRLTYKAELG